MIIRRAWELIAMSSGSANAYFISDIIADQNLKAKAPRFDPETIEEGMARVHGWIVYCTMCQHTHARLGRKGRCFTCDCGDRQ
jgi:hypothetical protein